MDNLRGELGTDCHWAVVTWSHSGRLMFVLLHTAWLSCWGHTVFILATSVALLLLIIIVARIISLWDVVLVMILILSCLPTCIALNDLWFIVSSTLVLWRVLLVVLGSRVLVLVILLIENFSYVVAGLIIAQAGVWGFVIVLLLAIAHLLLIIIILVIIIFLTRIRLFLVLLLLLLLLLFFKWLVLLSRLLLSNRLM